MSEPAYTPGLTPQASLRDSLGSPRMFSCHLCRGVIARSHRVVGVLDRLDVDRRAIRRIQSLRVRYGPGPVRLRVPR